MAVCCFLTFGVIYDNLKARMIGINESTLSIMPSGRNDYVKRIPIKIILLISLSLSFLVSSAYCEYYPLAAADFISFGLKFETFDQEYLFATNQSGLKMYRLVIFPDQFQLTADLIRLPFYLFSQISSLDQKTAVLRC
jgi:hypothetical protein